jgi:hypothetical protein
MRANAQPHVELGMLRLMGISRPSFFSQRRMEGCLWSLLTTNTSLPAVPSVRPPL